LGYSPGKQVLDADSQEIVAERGDEVVKPVLILRKLSFGLGFHVDLPKTPLGNIGEM
jgi:hypothetical protein